LEELVTPMVAKRVDHLPEGKEWSYEIKLDGYRALLIKDCVSTKLRHRCTGKAKSPRVVRDFVIAPFGSVDILGPFP
jgi:hypothetical protein